MISKMGSTREKCWTTSGTLLYFQTHQLHFSYSSVIGLISLYRRSTSYFRAVASHPIPILIPASLSSASQSRLR